MQGFPGQDLGFYPAQVHVAFEYVSLTDIDHKLVDRMCF